MAHPKYRRRKVIVERKMQIGLSATIVVVLSCYLLLFCLIAVYSPFATLLTGAASLERQTQAMAQIRYFVNHLLLPVGLTFACLALHCILLTHRIAGPAYRLRKTLESMREGDLSIDVKLRREDYLQDVADEYNAMIVGLRRDLAGAREQAAEMGRVARELTARTTGEAGSSAAEIVERAGRLEGILDGYQLESAGPVPEPAAEAAPALETA